MKDLPLGRSDDREWDWMQAILRSFDKWEADRNRMSLREK